MVGTHGIVTEGTAMAENVGRFGNGTIVPQDKSEALANAILRALTAPVSKTVAEEARNAIAAELSPSRIASLHYKLYQEVVRS